MISNPRGAKGIQDYAHYTLYKKDHFPSFPCGAPTTIIQKPIDHMESKSSKAMRKLLYRINGHFSDENRKVNEVHVFRY